MKKSILLLISVCLGSIAFGMEITRSGRVRAREDLTSAPQRSVADAIRLQQEAQEARLMEQAELDSVMYNATYNLSLCENELAELSRKYAEQVTQTEVFRIENTQLRRTLVLILQQLSTVYSVLGKSSDEQVRVTANLNLALRQLLELLMTDQPLGTVVAEWHAKLKKMSKLALDLVEMAGTVRKQQKKLQKEVGDLCGRQESAKELAGSLELENQELKIENERLKSELEMYSVVNSQIEKMMKLFEETRSKL